MRNNWNRATPVLELTEADVNVLLGCMERVFKVGKIEPTSGGLANTNLRVHVADLDFSYLLRLWTRDSKAADKEYRLYRMLKGNVPMPAMKYYSTENPVNGLPFMFMDWVQGVRLETILDALGPDDIAALGEALGSTLAAIHRYQFDSAGLFDGELEIQSPMEMSGAGLLSYTSHCLADPGAKERLGEKLASKLWKFLERENTLLDEWTGKPCLTHADFNGSNILVKNDSDGWKVAAVLDWEFAFSGTPFFDFGNLLRDPLGALPGIEDAIEAGYKKAGGNLPEKWRKMSKLTDLTAWLDFLTRENTGPQLISDCRQQISKTIHEW